MASYNELNALIDAYINRNGVQAITGQILNGVLKAMVEQLGRGYTIMGAATPTTDPGTPDGPECYFASETGTYTDFDGLQVVPGELALLCYTPSDGWTKATIYEGFQEVQATIDGNVGTPSVGVSYANGVLSFDFHNMKGNPGQNGQDGQDGQDGAAAGFGTIGADITGGVGTPGVTVESSGPATAKNLQFHFTNLKGETGVTSVVATVDNTTGTPACTVSLVGQQLTLAFTGLKGAQGNTGVSADYPIAIINNLTTDDPASALSAAQGVVLDGKVSQLEAKVDDLIQDADTEDDFDISDEDGNILARFSGGGIRTKNFDSSKSPESEDKDLGDLSIQDENGKCVAVFDNGEIKTKNFDSSLLKSQDDADSDFSVQDENWNIIFGIESGYPTTKNFNGKTIDKRISDLENKSGELEGWSKMPALGENPLSVVRFDGGMGRIFRTWGFIGDSLNSGEMYGKKTSVLSLSVEHQDTAISGGALVTEQGSAVTEQYVATAYQPRLRLVFESASGLSGKVLAASVSSGAYTPIITGDGNTTYTISITSGSSIVVSYPVGNVPQILFGNTFVQDMYDLSWGQQMARLLASSGYNFSVGGEYCKRWCIGSNNDRRWQKAQTDLKDAYTIALGVNDRSYWLSGNTSVVDYPCVSAYPNQNQYGGLTITKAEVLADIDLSDYSNNANSYAGWYSGIIQRLKSVRPDAHIFCITNPGEGGGKEWNQTIRLVVEIMQEKYGDTIWLLDLATYNPNTQEINANCGLNGHWSAFGYLYAAYEISTYVDWLIRNNIDAFRGSSLIGTGSSAKEWTII